MWLYNGDTLLLLPAVVANPNSVSLSLRIVGDIGCVMATWFSGDDDAVCAELLPALRRNEEGEKVVPRTNILADTTPSSLAAAIVDEAFDLRVDLLVEGVISTTARIWAVELARLPENIKKYVVKLYNNGPW